MDEEQKGSLVSALQDATGINATYWDYQISKEDNPYVIPLIEIPYSQFEEYEGLTLEPLQCPGRRGI